MILKLLCLFSTFVVGIAFATTIAAAEPARIAVSDESFDRPHDLVLSPPGTFEVGQLRHFHLVTLQLPGPVQGVSFHTHDLPRLQQISRAQLIDSLPACYPETRAWAQAAYLQRPSAQAISYGSRRNDAGRCPMLFKQRMPDPPLQVLKVEPLAIGPRRREVLALVRNLKLHEV